MRIQKPDAVSEFSEQIAEIDKTINKELFKQYFRYQGLISTQNELYKTRNTERNKIQTNLIKSNLEKFKNDIKNMSEDEKPYKIVDAVTVTLDFNNQNRRGQGLKIINNNRK